MFVCCCADYYVVFSLLEFGSLEIEVDEVDLNGLVVCAPSFEEVAILGIPEPTRSVPLVGLVDGSVGSCGDSVALSPSFFDTVLLHGVLAGKCRTVKSILRANRLGFSRCLKDALDKVVASPHDLPSWILFLFLPLCTLRVIRSRSYKKSGKKGCSQVDGISRALRVWREPGGPEVLVRELLKEGDRHTSMVDEEGEGVRKK
ncbi:hypothetical protein SOVF_068410, partial [Spinacia oleracea]